MPPKKPSKAKVIRSADGVERVAQACDRCRSKKTKCDGKRPQCSQCAAVGFECKISDRLSRRAFPRGYTESLEERVRELEAENRKLIALIDLKDEQLELLSKPTSNNNNNDNDNNDNDHRRDTTTIDKKANGINTNIPQESKSASFLPNDKSTSSSIAIPQPSKTHSSVVIDQESPLNSDNLSLLNQLNQPKLHTHEPHEEGCNCGCVNFPHSVHERPTSIAASVILGDRQNDNFDDDDNDDDLLSISSFESYSNDKLGKSNFFDDGKKQLVGLRNPATSSSSSNMNAYYNNFNVSFEQKEAPGAAAAMAIASMNNDRNKIKNQIATLVAMSTPRTTEEILFIPSLIGKLGNAHGFDSKPAVFTAKTLALLKYHFVTKNPNHMIDDSTIINLKNINFNKISRAESHLFFVNLKLPNRLDLDQLITYYFQEWHKLVPVVDQQEFLKNYMKLMQSAENKFNDNDMFGNEKFGAVAIIIVALALLGRVKCSRHSNDTSFAKGNQKSIRFIHSNKSSSTPFNSNYKNCDQEQPGVINDNDATIRLLNYYHHLIKQIISSSIVESCSMQSLQILSLALSYTLNVGDIGSSYTLRGKVVSMGQQLRLHRCPSAVLSNSGSIVSKIQQSERRILFWCIFILDAFGSLQLGVPRLLKDYEIECALPFANDDAEDDNNTNILMINNSPLSLVGKVSSLSLAMMRFSKILGNILDSIFRRGGVTIDALGKSCIILEDLLENWRKDLPDHLKFTLDVNGVLKNHDYQNYSNKILTTIVLYYQAKILIYLPVLAAEVRSSRGSSSYITIQQSTNTIMGITNFMAQQACFLATPFNCARMRARYGLLGAKGALDYARGGNLFQDLKSKLTDLIADLKLETELETPGCLSVNAIKTFEETIQSILSPPNSAAAILNGSANGKQKQKKNRVNGNGARKLISSSTTNAADVSSRFPKMEPNVHSPLSNVTNNNNNNNNNAVMVNNATPGGILLDGSASSMVKSASTETSVSTSSNGPAAPNVSVSSDEMMGFLESLVAQPMSVSSSTNQARGSPTEYEGDQNFFSEFAADGSLGLAQLLDLSLISSMAEQEAKRQENSPPINPDGEMKLMNNNGNESNIGSSIPHNNGYNANQYNTNQNPKNNSNAADSILQSGISAFFNNNDNNPVPTDEYSRGSFFQWQK
ncbi:DNA-binding transcription factor [Saccharomycopsis crataegensis]|uniref:DNA-binding transcription factor n=1 Tax=Saccharomycopsis crataegensis TaxID=43959 RepID=A0AAV5QLD8_9ASCO|nr:DNA-binding transcription factor [Saccharomycopsis crataegensis]